MESDIRKLVLDGKGEKIRALLLTSNQIELVKMVNKAGTLRASLLSHLQGGSIQNASAQLNRLYRAGYLNRLDTSASSGGIEYTYTTNNHR